MKFTILVFVVGIALVTAVSVDRMQVQIDFELDDEDNTQLTGKIPFFLLTYFFYIMFFL